MFVNLTRWPPWIIANNCEWLHSYECKLYNRTLGSNRLLTSRCFYHTRQAFARLTSSWYFHLEKVCFAATWHMRLQQWHIPALLTSVLLTSVLRSVPKWTCALADPPSKRARGRSLDNPFACCPPDFLTYVSTYAHIHVRCKLQSQLSTWSLWSDRLQETLAAAATGILICCYTCANLHN